MTPFKSATLILPPVREYIAQMMREGFTRRAAKHTYRKLKSERVFKNDTYQVNIDDAPLHNFPFALTHLSIKRIDKQPIHDWRELQAIKNALVGPEREAFELYPAESRKVDTANQFHLWVIAEGVQIPCGWTVRLVTDTPGLQAVQRPGSEWQQPLTPEPCSNFLPTATDPKRCHLCLQTRAAHTGVAS